MDGLIAGAVETLLGLPRWLLGRFMRVLQIALCIACFVAPAAVADGITAAAQARAAVASQVFTKALQGWMEGMVDDIAELSQDGLPKA